MQSLFLQHVAASFDKQLHLADLVGELAWSFNKPKGRLSFEGRYCWSVQILGTEDHVAGTWLWAWANEASTIPPKLLRAGLEMKKLGEEEGIPQLTKPLLPLDEADGHTLSLIASGVCEADGYYRGPYPGGAVFLLVRDKMFPHWEGDPLARIVRVFPQLISSLDVADHRLAFAGYLAFYGLDGEAVRNKVVVKSDGEPALTAAFDSKSRLTKLEAAVGRKRR